MKIAVILTMAGDGSRFKQAGVDVPKPLIRMPDGRLMYEWVVDPLTKIPNIELFITIKEELLEPSLGFIDSINKKSMDEINLVPLDKLPNGQAESAFSATEFIGEGTPIIILGCDSYENFEGLIKKIKNHSDKIGILSSFKEYEKTHFSFAKVEGNAVIEVREKDKISDNALSGVYYFASKEAFLAAYFAEKTSLTHGEMYVAPLYNHLIKLFGKKSVGLIQAEEYSVFGTPEELESVNN